MKALSKDPNERYYSLQQFADELEIAYFSPMKLDNSKRSFLKKTIITGGIVVSIITIGGVEYWFWHNQPHIQSSVKQPPLPTYQGYNGRFTAIDWSFDGHFIAVGSEEGIVNVFDSRTLETGYVYRGHQTHSILQICWVPKNPSLLSSLDNTGNFFIYNAFTGEPHHPLFPLDPNHPIVAFSWAEFADLTTANSKQVDVYDSPLNQGTSLPDIPFTKHNDFIKAVMWGWGPNNSLIVTGDSSSQVYIWDSETAKLLYSYQYSYPIVSIAFGPQPGLFAVAGQKEVCILRAGTSSTTTKIASYSHNGLVNQIAWSPDKKNPRLASCGDDKCVIIWTVSRHTKKVHKFNTPINGLSWSPDGRHLALANEDKTVVILEV